MFLISADESFQSNRKQFQAQVLPSMLEQRPPAHSDQTISHTLGTAEAASAAEHTDGRLDDGNEHDE